MVITGNDLDKWCNCGNFPYQKCDDCILILGDVTHISDDEVLITDENGGIAKRKRYKSEEGKDTLLF